MTLLAENRLGVKLHAFDHQLFMPNAHNLFALAGLV